METRRVATARTVSIERLRAWLVSRAQSELRHWSDFRLSITGAFGATSMIVFFWVWRDLLPQPYESFGLRLVGALLFVPVCFAAWTRSRSQALLLFSFYAASLYCIPIFCTYMLLRNEASEVWIMTGISVIYVGFLLVGRWQVALVRLGIGIPVGMLAYGLTVAEPVWLPSPLVKALPVIVFSLMAAAICNASLELLTERRLNAMFVATSSVAHELRTPLLSIQATARGIQKHLTPLFERIPPGKDQRTRQQLQDALARIEHDLQQMTINIDLLLANARGSEGASNFTDQASIRQAVSEALSSYPFASARERKLVYFREGGDFAYHGSKELIVFTIYNLLKNALRAVLRARHGEIVIVIDGAQRTVVMSDTGTGIEPQVVPLIFNQFFSYPPNTSTGMGLTFCKRAIESMHGQITVESELGQSTTFTIHL